MVEAARRLAAGPDVADCPRSTRRIAAYLRAVDEAVARLRAVEAGPPRRCSTSSRCAPRVQRLRCFRGIDDLTALTIAAELGDPAPLRHGPEHDGVCRPRPVRALQRDETGARRASPKPAMRICAASSSKPRGTIAIIRSSAPRFARANAARPPTVIAQAWTAQQRLHRRYQRLAARGKPKQHIVTAVARELTGFVWAALTQ